MVDLSHWDFQGEFELSEVASLIAGVEPKQGKKMDETSGIPSPIGKRVLDAAVAAYMCQKKQKPIPADCLQSSMFKVSYKEKGVLANIADMAFGSSDVVVQRGEVSRTPAPHGNSVVENTQLLLSTCSAIKRQETWP